VTTTNVTECEIGAWQVSEGAVDAIAQMRSPIFIAHVVPDADALGSMFAMALAYRGDGCQPKVSLPPGSLSQKLAFLWDWAEVELATLADFQAADGFVVLDTAKKPRCNVERALKVTQWDAGKPVVNIDHHATNTQFGKFNWVVGEASSTAELVYHLLLHCGKSISPIAASCLYAGIHGDTAGFSLPTTTASSLKAAGELVKLGARVAELGKRLCRSQTQSEFDLLRIIYSNTKLAADGQIAYSTANYAEIMGAGCKAADIDDQVTVPRSLSGVRLSFLLTEGNKGKTRINFRSEGNVDVLGLAKQWGGGGHHQSAGAVVDGCVAEVAETVLKAAVVHIKKFQ